MLNIMVVEDNVQLRKLMRIQLARAGYNVFEANDGEEALEILAENPIHLMVVDIMMPKMDGYELTGELRNANFSIPVIMVTAKETLEDKRAGFKSGADDYMVKPIDMEELLLRVQALIRRSQLSNDHIMEIGETRLDADALTATIKGVELSLRPKEFGLLHHLLSYPNKIFTRQALMDELWGYESDTDPRTVDVHIKRLREKFEDSDDFRIETIRGLGYKAVIRN